MVLETPLDALAISLNDMRKEKRVFCGHEESEMNVIQDMQLIGKRIVTASPHHNPYS
jgi:hypothetical protein